MRIDYRTDPRAIGVAKLLLVVENVGGADGNGLLVLVVKRPAEILERGVGRILVGARGQSAAGGEIVPSAPELVDVAVVREEERIPRRVAEIPHIVPGREDLSDIH